MVNVCISTYNASYQTIPQTLVYREWEWYFYNICIPSIAFLGVVFNVFFILVVFRTPYMHTVTNRYLCHLAIADLLFLCVYTTNCLLEFNMSSYNIREDYTNLGPLLCPVFSVVTGMGLSGSTGFIMLVSFERYLAICLPIKHRLMKGETRTRWMISIIWVSAFLFALMFIPFHGIHQSICLTWWDHEGKYISHEIQACSSTTGNGFKVFNFSWIWVWILLFIANFIMYWKIIVCVRKDSSIYKEGNSTLIAMRIRRRRQVAVMLVINGVMFFICCAITNIHLIANFVTTFEDFSAFPSRIYFESLHTVAALANSSINPLVYGLTNKEYRRAFREYLCRVQN